MIIIINEDVSNKTIVAPDGESTKKLQYMPKNAVIKPIMDDRINILKKLFVISLADIAGAIIATASKVAPMVFIADITTMARTMENNKSTLSVFIP